MTVKARVIAQYHLGLVQSQALWESGQHAARRPTEQFLVLNLCIASGFRLGNMQIPLYLGRGSEHSEIESRDSTSVEKCRSVEDLSEYKEKFLNPLYHWNDNMKSASPSEFYYLPRQWLQRYRPDLEFDLSVTVLDKKLLMSCHSRSIFLLCVRTANSQTAVITTVSRATSSFAKAGSGILSIACCMRRWSMIMCIICSCICNYIYMSVSVCTNGYIRIHICVNI